MNKQFLSFGLFFLFLALSFVNLASAQKLTPTLVPSTQATQSSIIKYDLAYPGILPDHPLYKLKVLRDKISLALISDPVKKIEFYLLQADKGILAAAMLVDKNNISLAGHTSLKAENNFTLISDMLRPYYYRQRPDLSNPATIALLKKIKTASLKHQEVLNSFLKRVPQNQQETFKTVIYFSKINIENIEKTTEDYRLGKGSFENSK